MQNDQSKNGHPVSVGSTGGSAKIVQLLLTPNDATWQGRLLGLGSDGVTYEIGEGTRWVPMIAPLGYPPNQ